MRKLPGRSRPFRKWMGASWGMVEGQATDIRFEYVHSTDPGLNDSLIEKMPDGSLVINATGMGKDIPGSPITGQGVFPRQGVVWDLNYRGELDFYYLALAEQRKRDLLVEDGWLYFLHGWSMIAGLVLRVDITPDSSNAWPALPARSGFLTADDNHPKPIILMLLHRKLPRGSQLVYLFEPCWMAP